MKNIKILTTIFITLLIITSCDEEDKYNCPENIKLPPQTNTGENIVACKIDGEVWIGDQGIYIEPWSGVKSQPSFHILENYFKDGNGNYKLDSIYQLSFFSSYIYDCIRINNYKFSLRNFYLSLNSNGVQPFNNEWPFIKFVDLSNMDSLRYYHMNYDKPYQLKVSLDTALGIASGTFSGIFTDYKTGDELVITDGFFDMKEGMPDDR